MEPREYAVVLALGVLLGVVAGGLVVAFDVQPFETVDDAVGENELAGIEDGSAVGTESGGGDETATADDGGSTPEGTPTPSSDGGTATATAAPDTRTATASGGGDGTETDAGSATPTATATPAQFAFVVEEITECGRTCRTVTSSVTNDGDETATSVVVETRLYAGNSTAESDRIYTGTEDVGALAAGEAARTTRDVDLSASEALAVDEAGGWVTVETIVRSDQTTERSTTRRQAN